VGQRRIGDRIEGARPDFGTLGSNKERARIDGREEMKRERVFYFEKQPNQMNSNTNLNSSTQKQCTSMYATMNSYISLFN
jgi:hypothetical protein